MATKITMATTENGDNDNIITTSNSNIMITMVMPYHNDNDDNKEVTMMI